MDCEMLEYRFDHLLSSALTGISRTFCYAASTVLDAISSISKAVGNWSAGTAGGALFESAMSRGRLCTWLSYLYRFAETSTYSTDDAPHCIRQARDRITHGRGDEFDALRSTRLLRHDGILRLMEDNAVCFVEKIVQRNPRC
jgi:hypothetical protein